MPADPADREFLAEQYRTASNLQARIRLHERFSTNSSGWHHWVFDQFALVPAARVLEIGCGPGHLWLENLRRIPSRWRVVLSDASPGMIAEAALNLKHRSPVFTFAVADAQAISFADGVFDAVIANHMLYHVSDRPRAFAEIARVLRPAGQLYATTNGCSHLQEIDELLRRYDPRAVWGRGKSFFEFTLENGFDQMSPWFADVTLHRYDDALVVTQAEPLVAYVLSGRGRAVLAGGRVAEFSAFVEGERARRGVLRISKDAGLFKCVRRDGP